MLEAISWWHCNVPDTNHVTSHSWCRWPGSPRWPLTAPRRWWGCCSAATRSAPRSPLRPTRPAPGHTRCWWSMWLSPQAADLSTRGLSGTGGESSWWGELSWHSHASDCTWLTWRAAREQQTPRMRESVWRKALTSTDPCWPWATALMLSLRRRPSLSTTGTANWPG